MGKKIETKDTKEEKEATTLEVQISLFCTWKISHFQQSSSKSTKVWFYIQGTLKLIYLCVPE
jgi:hypothetical protein